MHEYAAVVLAGGRGRRLGGPAKPAIAVGGLPMLQRVLAAVAAAEVRVVVGPAELAVLVPAGVRMALEQPAGGGPVAALAAGLLAVPADAGQRRTGIGRALPTRVAVLAADLPLLSASAVDRLVAAIGDGDGAVYVDGSGRHQWLCGAWRADALRRRVAEFAAAGPLAGRSLRDLFAPLRVAAVSAAAGEPPPWYDCDTPAAVAEAESFYGGSA
jgi:molybdopterin-guanine dinucleotide biosynthesis protein A